MYLHTYVVMISWIISTRCIEGLNTSVLQQVMSANRLVAFPMSLRETTLREAGKNRYEPSELGVFDCTETWAKSEARADEDDAEDTFVRDQGNRNARMITRSTETWALKPRDHVDGIRYVFYTGKRNVHQCDSLFGSSVRLGESEGSEGVKVWVNWYYNRLIMQQNPVNAHLLLRTMILLGDVSPISTDMTFFNEEVHLGDEAAESNVGNGSTAGQNQQGGVGGTNSPQGSSATWRDALKTRGRHGTTFGFVAKSLVILGLNPWKNDDSEVNKSQFEGGKAFGKFRLVEDETSSGVLESLDPLNQSAADRGSLGCLDPTTLTLGKYRFGRKMTQLESSVVANKMVDRGGNTGVFVTSKTESSIDSRSWRIW